MNRTYSIARREGLSESPLFLIGYMGAGKTTFGRALARETGREFIDLDFYIEQRFRMSVREIFARYGEREFRRMEGEMLREAGEFEHVIIACGGGTPCFGDNMEYMLARGLTVHLEASVDCLVSRLLAGGARRPLVAGKSESELREYLDTHLAERMPYYARAHVTFDSGRLEDKRQITESVRAFMKEVPLFRTETNGN